MEAKLNEEWLEMRKINKRGGWFYYIANSNPINWNGGKSSKTINVDSTFIKEARVSESDFYCIYLEIKSTN